MKTKIFFLISFILFLLNCRSQDNESQNHLAGRWKLVQVKQAVINNNGLTEVSNIDYTSKKIIYTFQEDKFVVVTGATNEQIGYLNGQHTYTFITETDPSLPTHKLNYIVIDQSKWLYSLGENKLTLNQMHVDGPELTFEKVK